MRNYAIEYEKRVAFIRNILADSGMNGIVYGNSGGKDSALVGILCKAACENTLGIIMPCAAKRNYEKDMDDALEVAKGYSIETRVLDLTPVRDVEIANLSRITSLNEIAAANLAPRLRMLSLYAVAAAEKRLVAGTGNRSETYVGYFTKWGDGAYDFNPIADLTVTEIYEFLDFLKAPLCVIEKSPSAALFDGQTDEMELGVTYRELDDFLMGRSISEEKKKIVESKHERSEHKRKVSIVYR